MIALFVGGVLIVLGTGGGGSRDGAVACVKRGCRDLGAGGVCPRDAPASRSRAQSVVGAARRLGSSSISARITPVKDGTDVIGRPAPRSPPVRRASPRETFAPCDPPDRRLVRGDYNIRWRSPRPTAICGAHSRSGPARGRRRAIATTEGSSVRLGTARRAVPLSIGLLADRRRTRPARGVRSRRGTRRPERTAVEGRAHRPRRARLRCDGTRGGRWLGGGRPAGDPVAGTSFWAPLEGTAAHRPDRRYEVRPRIRPCDQRGDGVLVLIMVGYALRRWRAALPVAALAAGAAGWRWKVLALRHAGDPGRGLPAPVVDTLHLGAAAGSAVSRTCSSSPLRQRRRCCGQRSRSAGSRAASRDRVHQRPRDRRHRRRAVGAQFGLRSGRPVRPDAVIKTALLGAPSSSAT